MRLRFRRTRRVSRTRHGGGHGGRTGPLRHVRDLALRRRLFRRDPLRLTAHGHRRRRDRLGVRRPARLQREPSLRGRVRLDARAGRSRRARPRLQFRLSGLPVVRQGRPPHAGRLRGERDLQLRQEPRARLLRRRAPASPSSRPSSTNVDPSSDTRFTGNFSAGLQGLRDAALRLPDRRPVPLHGHSTARRTPGPAATTTATATTTTRPGTTTASSPGGLIFAF